MASHMDVCQGDNKRDVLFIAHPVADSMKAVRVRCGLAELLEEFNVNQVVGKYMVVVGVQFENDSNASGTVT